MDSEHLLAKLVAGELDTPVDRRVSEMAEAIAALFPGAARAVLFYGSCLRERVLDGLMLDFYLIVSDYHEAYSNSWLAAANRLVPPNVFPFERDGLAAKYAVLSEADFHRECGPGARSVSVWARFAQPSRLVWTADAEARTMAIASIAQAAPTLLGRTSPTMHAGEAADPLPIWRKGFGLTYGAELRAERGTRPGAVVDADPVRYRQFAEAAGFARPHRRDETQRRAAEQRWKRDQARGKRLSVLRLLKASLTFAGGIDYLAWKINRHAGTAIAIRPWQRRWPILGGLILLPRLLWRGAIR